MRVVVAVERADVRSALCLLLTHELDMHVIGEAADGAALQVMLQAGCPDLLLVDWDMLVGRPDVTVHFLRSHCPDLLVVALSGQGDGSHRVRDACLDGLISTRDSASQVAAAIRALRDGGAEMRRSMVAEQGPVVKGTR